MSFAGQPPQQRRRWPSWAVAAAVLVPVVGVLLILGAVTGGDDDRPALDPQDVAGPIARTSRLLLAAATSDVERLPAAIADMDAACDELG